MSKIIYTNPEGGVSVVHPTGEVPISELPAKLGLTDYEIVDDEVIPTDRTFRNAWVKSGSTVAEDLPKCKEIAHERRRAARAEEFKPHDEVISKQIPGADATAAEASALQSVLSMQLCSLRLTQQLRLLKSNCIGLMSIN